MDPRPSPEASSSAILSTPLVVMGMLTHVLRQRFILINPPVDPILPWAWSPVLEDTGIFIESGWNKELEARTTRPGVWVDQLQTIYTRSSIGHQDQVPLQIRSGLESFHIFGHTDVAVDCTSPNRGESLMLGGIIQDFVQMSTFIIQKWFGLREISDVIMNRSIPFEYDDNLWSTQVQFRVGFETRWVTAQIVPLLNQLAMTLPDPSVDPADTRQILAQKAYGSSG